MANARKKKRPKKRSSSEKELAKQRAVRQKRKTLRAKRTKKAERGKRSGTKRLGAKRRASKCPAAKHRLNKRMGKKATATPKRGGKVRTKAKEVKTKTKKRSKKALREARSQAAKKAWRTRKRRQKEQQERQRALDAINRHKDQIRSHTPKVRKRGEGKQPRLAPVRQEVRELGREVTREELSEKELPDTRKGHRELLEQRRQVFGELFQIAEATKQLPRFDKRDVKIDSRLNVGKQVWVEVDLLVESDSVEEILYQVKQAVEKRFPPPHHYLWMGVLAMSGLGENFGGYGQRILSANHAEAKNFQTQKFDSTGLYRSAGGMLEELESLLEKLASSAYTLTYLHYVKVMNFDRKRRG